MPVSSFSCPHCQAPLRIRDQDLMEKQVACPDCQQPFMIVSDAATTLKVKKIDGTKRKKRPSSSAVGRDAGKQSKRHLGQAITGWSDQLKNPLVVAWSVAGAVTLLFVLIIWPKDSSIPREKQTLESSAELESSDEETAAGTLVPDPGRLEHPKLERVQQVAGESVQELPVPDEGEQPPVEARVPNVPPNVVLPVEAIKPIPEPEEVVVLPAEVAEPVDVKSQLAQPILRFEQSSPVSFRELLTLVEEMAGIPIHYDQVEPAVINSAFDKKVSLDLSRTTVGNILDELLKQVGLAYKIDKEGVRLVSATGEKEAS